MLYRSQVKEIIANQIEYYTSAKNIVNAIFSGTNKAQAVENELSTSQNREKTELALKNYIEELD